MTQMSKESESALLGAQASRAGAAVPECTRELIEKGYATEAGNLTDRGARKRNFVSQRRLDEAFG